MKLISAALLFAVCGQAAQYYIAPSPLGNDSNNGTTIGTPWLTPNHAVNCGDVIQAAAGSYSGFNFDFGWGTVTCAGGDNVAWLTCITFDACKIVNGSTSGMVVDHSYWGVQGWEVQTIAGSSDLGCFAAISNFSVKVEIHHIIFANNIANGCQEGGFVLGPQTSTAGADYVAFIGNIAYNAAQGNSQCYSALDMFEPIASDTKPGTHLYVAGNFSWASINPNPCNGGTPTDGEGLIFDTFDGSTGIAPGPYRQQAVADNNMLIGNGGRGLQANTNNAGAGPFAHIYLRRNTVWGNNTDQNQNNDFDGEVFYLKMASVEAFLNIASTGRATGGGGFPLYAYGVWQTPTPTALVYKNVGWSATGTYSQATSSSGFTYGPNNLFGTNPQFANPSIPGAPSCGSATSVPNCMATVIANFTTTNSAVAGYGYQTPSPTSIYDPLYPQWLCGVSLPAGLVTPGCIVASSSTALMSAGIVKK